MPPAAAPPRRKPDGAAAAADRGRELWSAELALHEAELRSASRYICRDDGEREDLIQDTFERALRHLGAGNPKPINLRAWLVSILRNAFIDRKRRAAIARMVFDDSPAAVPAPEPEPQPLWSSVSLDDVRAALGEIEEAQRRVFELHYLSRMRYDQIASELGIPSNTVGTRLFRARKALREILLRGLTAAGPARMAGGET
jgi:RNA polymerase sigma-70 factor, ECF subfamily